jgi:7,8-dihydropterin-6-yl-methyl-4-(beta-D-ribofuranosyl)aminobenzene 5'-phosphate synthase
MRVTTLIENRPSRSDRNLVAEWGLSLHIAFNGHSILFDAGTSGAFAKNAKYLSIDVASIDTAVLSHHHFDHGGGLRRFFELNAGAKVHLGEMPHGDCYGKVFGLVTKYVGLDKKLIADHGARFQTVTKPVEILPDVFVLPHITGTHSKPRGNKRIFLKKDGTFTLDHFDHEIVMAIKENGKLVVFTGCSHNGILNMVDVVAAEFSGIPIKAVIGGFHLVAAPPLNFMAGSKREVEELARSVLDYPIEMTYTGHCTGTKAFPILKGVMGERITDVRTGSSVEI